MVYRLGAVPAAATIFLDANVLVYGARGRSPQSVALLERCRVAGIELFAPDDER